MREDHQESETHVLIFPCPAQGHINCMLQLAELLVLSDIHVTVLNTEHIHQRLLRFAEVPSRLAAYPTLHFKTFSDGLPSDDPRRQEDYVGEQIKQVNLMAMPRLREICVEASGKPRFSCIIADGIFGRLTNEVGQELGIPVVYFRTISACSFWAYFCAPRLFESNELPIRGEKDMDRMITSIPGMENLVRCRDLPSFFRANHKSHIPLEPVVFETHQSLRAQALILNTFEDLEGPVLSQIRHHFPRFYALGPLHAHLNSRKATKTMSSETSPPSFESSLWEVDRSCMTWLDAQQPKSVVYVSFGSITKISRDELMEIWHGLVNSKKRFLWVIRPGMLSEKEGQDPPMDLVEGTKERGRMVGWAPQKEVLAHVAIGGFMTHCGWNSTLEGVAAGVPMMCWPYFADQQINSRYVSEVWKIGLEMKDVCDRKLVEEMVNDLMVERRQEFEKSTQAMATLAKTSVREGGSSYSDFDRFVQFLKSAREIDGSLFMK
ncbi:7-deoxyloganetic acid glucosyltransferase-like [Prosopis cineraria]|uniref:7-deoxyloganetic acid glucosyltransferase-like n=1 Tax=Prosopis cineraria TaxID=364024 RepID=UPI00240EA698|nr:7-deoxyloganetic acid glucosyltransferase-like [Prosopis cineraria]